jgi:hypothetical protein
VGKKVIAKPYIQTDIFTHPELVFFLFFVGFLAVLGFELRASFLLGRHSAPERLGQPRTSLISPQSVLGTNE